VQEDIRVTLRLTHLFLSHSLPGQVVSDVSGVIFGGTLERFLTRMKLIQTPSLTTQQRQLPVCRNVAMAGAVIGVIIGCALGATTLLLVDLEARDRIQRAAQLREIVQDMMQASTLPARCKCTVYIAGSSKDFTLGAEDEGNATTKNDQSTFLLFMSENDTEARLCSVKRGSLLTNDGRILYAPVIKKNSKAEDDNAVMAVLAFQSENAFSTKVLEEAEIMTRHIAIFMEHLSE
jgi:Transmembrane protein 65